SFMGLLGVPFVYGPVSGGDEIPRGYMAGFSLKQRLLEWARVAVNYCVRFDPLMLMTFATSNEVYFTSRSHLQLVPGWVGREARTELPIGCAGQFRPAADPAANGARPGPRLVFVGRCIGWKGMDIGLPAFAKVLQRHPNATLTVIGDG